MRISGISKFGEEFIKVEGELVRENASDFIETILGRTEDAGAKVSLEMWDLEFIDSTGLGSLLELSDTLRKSGRSLYLFKVNPNVKRVLTSVHVHGKFNIVNNI